MNRPLFVDKHDPVGIAIEDNSGRRLLFSKDRSLDILAVLLLEAGFGSWGWERSVENGRRGSGDALPTDPLQADSPYHGRDRYSGPTR